MNNGVLFVNNGNFLRRGWNCF